MILIWKILFISFKDPIKRYVPVASSFWRFLRFRFFSLFYKYIQFHINIWLFSEKIV